MLTKRSENGEEKETKQKRLLLEEYPDHHIGKSDIPVQKQSHDVCMCSYHENINMLLNSLNNHARAIKLKLDFNSTNSADIVWVKTVSQFIMCFISFWIKMPMKFKKFFQLCA